MAHDWEFLPYNLRWLEDLQQGYSGGGDCDAAPIYFVPKESQQLVLYEWNGEQFLKILSSIVKGAQLSYPDDWMQVVQWVLEGVDCPVEICAKVADCIENSAAVQSALADFNAQWLADKQYQPMPDGTLNETLADGYNPTCNNDIVWAQCIGIVERCNGFVVDLLETLADEDTAAKVAGVLAGLPGIENLGLGAITDLAGLLFEVPLAAYNADYSTSYAETLACELFCLCKDDCNISIGRMFGILNARITAVVPEMQSPALTWGVVEWATAIANYVVGLLTINKADLMFYLMFGGLRFGEVVLGVNDGLRQFNIAALLAADEPSNDWLTLCDDCPSCPLWVFTANPFSDVWALRNYGVYKMGKYTAGVGYESISANMGGFQQCQILISTDDIGFTCNTVGVSWAQTGTMSGGVRAVYWFNTATNTATLIGNLSDTNSAGSKYATVGFALGSRPSGSNHMLIALSNTNLSVTSRITGVEFA